MDDGIRERHGVSRRINNAGRVGREPITVSERDFDVVVECHSFGGVLTEWQARYIAAKMYRLSRRIRDRRLADEQSSISVIAA